MTTGTPYRVALVRGAINAVIVGGLTFLGTWSTTDDLKTLIIATGTSVLTTIAVRFGFEGTIDTRRGGGSPGTLPGG